MIGADGRRADEAHTATVEQRGMATGAGADNQRIGVTDCVTRDILGLKIKNLGSGLDDALDVGDVAVNDNLHGISRFAVKKAIHEAMNKMTNT